MRIDKKYIFNQLLVAFLLLKNTILADYVATLGTCPASFQRINNGCYQFFDLVADKVNWTTASSRCEALSTQSPLIRVHLLSLESEAETIAMAFWFKGNTLSRDYWIDGTLETKAATYITPEFVDTIWDWSDQSAYLYDYLRYSNLNRINTNYMYLFYNGSTAPSTYTGGHEYKSSPGSDTKNFVCEAQLLCNATENKCMNNGTCYVNSGRVLCICPSGYVGSLCEQLTDNCDAVPCKHGATCTNLVNNYTCSCTEYYTGPTCDTPVENKFKDARTIVLYVCVGIVGGIVALLCLMDLPWNGILKHFKSKETMGTTSEEQQANEANQSAVNEGYNATKSSATRAQLLNSEEEILRKLQQTMQGGKMRNRAGMMMY